VVGEGYNGAKAVGQVLEVTGLKVNWVAHVLHTIGQPLVFPFEFIFGRILGVDFPAQASYFSDLVLDELGEVLSPMGGWYILADFIYYGWAGVGLLAIYEWIAWRVSKYLLDTDYFPFGSYVFLISIKATPYIYYKFLFYIFIISFCFGWCRRGWVNFGRAMRVRIV
jgi:hypothetical protein